MKFFTAIKQSEFAAALFTAAGLDFETMFAAGNVNALKDHLGSLKPTEEASALSAKVKTLTDENATLNAALTAAKGEIETALAATKSAEAFSGLLSSALAAAGVKLPTATAEKPLDQAAVQGAIDARISTKAREKLAAHGHNDPLPVEPAADPSSQAKPAASVKGIERTIAAFKAKSSGKN